MYAKTHFHFLLLCLFFLTSGLAQKVSGVVFDGVTKQPLPNVKVFLADTSIGTITDRQGAFILNRPTFALDRDTLTFSLVGRKTLKMGFNDLNAQGNIILMEEFVNQLGEVVLSGEQKIQHKLRYQKRAPLTKGIFGFGSALFEDIIYVIGGNGTFKEDSYRRAIRDASVKNPYRPTWNEVLNEVEANGDHEYYNNGLLTYDIYADLWFSEDMDFENREGHVAVPFENKLYVVGGKKTDHKRVGEYLLNTIEILDLSTKEIVVDQTNPHQSVDFACFVYKDNLILMGGSNRKDRVGRKVFTYKVHMFNISSGYWYELEPMTKAKQVNGVLVQDKIYLIGGLDGEPLTEIESLDLITGKWNKEGDLFYPMENPSITENEGIIYIYNYGQFILYDTFNKTMHSYDIDLYVHDPQLHYHDHRLFLLGGYNKDRFSQNPSSDVYAIDVTEFKRTRTKKSKVLD